MALFALRDDSMSSVDFGANVSRETVERLEAFADLVRKWNPKINLVSKSTLDDLMNRHIADSVQIFDVIGPNFTHWADFGSGGGFPGIVVAIIAKAEAPEARITLVESDARKCAFLREAARQLSLNVKVFNERIEKVPALVADVISARALARLNLLCEFAIRHGGPDFTAVFPKGETYQDEIDEAKRTWGFDLEVLPSKTEAKAAILKLRNIANV